MYHIVYQALLSGIMKYADKEWRTTPLASCFVEKDLWVTVSMNMHESIVTYSHKKSVVIHW